MRQLTLLALCVVRDRDLTNGEIAYGSRGAKGRS